MSSEKYNNIEPNFIHDIGKRIKEIRVELLNLTQNQLAEKLGVKSKTNISNWEKGISEIPLRILFKIAEISNVSTDWILGLTENKNEKLNLSSKKDICGYENKILKTKLAVYEKAAENLIRIKDKNL